MPRWLKYSLLILAFLLLVSIPLAMPFETGSIEGIITDDQGPVAGACVQARNVMTDAVFHVESDAMGYYKLEDLRAGRYSLWVQAAGHDSVWILQIPVERDQSVRQDLYLARSQRDTTGL